MFTVIKWLCFYYMSLSGSILPQGVTEHKGVWEYWVLNRSFYYTDSYDYVGRLVSHSEYPTDSFVVKEIDSVREVTKVGDTLIINYFGSFFTSLNKSLTIPQFSDTTTDTISTIFKIYKDPATNLIEVVMNGNSVPKNGQLLLDTNKVTYIGDSLMIINFQFAGTDTFSYLDGIGIIDGGHNKWQEGVCVTTFCNGHLFRYKAQLISWNGNIFLPNEVKQIPASVIRATNQSVISPNVSFSNFSNSIFDLRGRKIMYQTNRSNGCYIYNHSNHIFINNYFLDRGR